MVKTVLNVKVDSDVKKKAQKLSKQMGIPLSLVVGVGLKTFVRERRLEVVEPYVLKPKVAREVQKISEEMRRGKNTSPAFSNMKDALQWLDS